LDRASGEKEGGRRCRQINAYDGNRGHLHSSLTIFWTS
jgi:hypothetical protein